MKYLRTYEGTKPFNRELRKKFIDSENEPYITLNLPDIQEQCYTNNINLLNLLREILINKKITFRCTWCYDDDIEDVLNLSNIHSIIGKCVDVIHEDREYFDSDILVKVDGYEGYHTILIGYTKNQKKQKVRIYNYTEGKLINKINILKDIEKYNL